MIIGTGGFDPESALADSLLRWQARLTALVTGPCAGYMAAQAAIITPPPPSPPWSPDYTPAPTGWQDAP